MAYKFNSMTGRVGASVPQMAYSPAGLKPAAAEPPEIVWDQKPKLASRQASHMGGDGVFGKLVRNRVYENQKIFQVMDGVPVHLKKGFPDRVGYSAAMALTVVGTVWTCYALYQLSQAKK